MCAFVCLLRCACFCVRVPVCDGHYADFPSGHGDDVELVLLVGDGSSKRSVRFLASKGAFWTIYFSFRLRFRTCFLFRLVATMCIWSWMHALMCLYLSIAVRRWRLWARRHFVVSIWISFRNSATCARKQKQIIPIQSVIIHDEFSMLVFNVFNIFIYFHNDLRR